VLGDHPALEEDLREAQRLDLLREIAARPERRYAFKHPLVQDAVYNTLLVRRRHELHELVGRALEALYAGRLEELYAALARHYAAAGHWERAFEFALLEGDRAAAARATRESLEHYRLAWRAAAELTPPPDDDRLAMLLEKRGDVEALLGLGDEAIESYRGACDRLDPAVDTSRLGRLDLKLARVAMQRQDPLAAEQYVDVAFAALPPEAPELSFAWSVRSWLLVWRNQYAAAAEAGDRALELARRSDDFAALVEAYEALCHPALGGLPGRDAGALAEAWIAAARRCDDQVALLRALSAAVHNRLWISGAADPATLRAAREAVGVAEGLGAQVGLRIARCLLGGCLFAQGRWDEAAAELTAAREGEGDLAPDRELVAFWLGLLESWRGRLDIGRNVLEEALGLPGFPHSRIWLNQALALNRWLAGDETGARAALAEGGEAADRLACLPCRGGDAGEAAELWVALGEADQAERWVAVARELGDRLDRRPTLLAAERAEAALAGARGEWPRAIRRLRAVLRGAHALGQPFEIARAELLLGRALTRADRPADRERALDHLRTALDLFRDLGVDPAEAEALTPSDARPDAEQVTA
jgi:tetratricopeptide (TPR) repeat protein